MSVNESEQDAVTKVNAPDNDAELKQMNEAGPGEQASGCPVMHELVAPTQGDANQ